MSNFRDIFTLKYLKQIYTWKTPEQLKQLKGVKCYLQVSG